MSRNNSKSSASNEKKGNYKGKRNYKKSNKKDNSIRQGKETIERAAGMEKGDADNDPNYYFVSKEVAEQASQLSFQSILGQGDLHGYRVPTVAVIEDVMNPGCTENVRTAVSNQPIEAISGSTTNLSHRTVGKAGVNVMSSKLYTLLGVWSGRISNYQPQDVAIMILAIAAISEFSEHIRRFFGLLLTYNFRNRQVPLALIRMLGCDPDDLKKNISDYRMRFNVCMSRINQIPLLDNIAFIRKCRERYQRVYMDDPTNMGQLFAYVPKYYFTLDEVGDNDGSILAANPIRPANASNEVTMDTLLSRLEAMITAVLESSTLNLIYADLLHMASKMSVPTWQFDYLAENYVVMPEYNANALLQFHNLTIVGTPGLPNQPAWDIAKHKYTDGNGVSTWITGSAHVFCDANANNIVYNPIFSQPHVPLKWFVDMPTDNPDLVMRVESMRNMALFSGSKITNTDIGSTGTGIYATLVALPDHYIADIYVYDNYDVRSNAEKADTSIYAAQPNYPIVQATQFEHFPAIVNGTTTFAGVRGGLQYFTEVDFAYIKRLLDCMSIGLFEFRQ